MTESLNHRVAFRTKDSQGLTPKRAPLDNCTFATRYLMVQVAASALVAAVCTAATMDMAPSPTTASFMFTVSIAWMLYSWARMAQSIISPYWIFLIAATLFNGGHAILQVFGLNENGVMKSAFSEATTSSALMYVTLSMMLLHLGALWRVAAQPRRTLEPESQSVDNNAIRLGLLLVLIALVPTYLQFRDDLSAVLSGGYFSLYQREIKTSFGAWQALLAQFMLPGAFLLAASSKHRRGIRRLSLLIVLTYVCLHMFTGYRGAAGAAIGAFAWIWHTRIKKLPVYPSAIAGLLVVFILFPMIRVYRSAAGEDRLSWSSFISTLENYDNPATASVREMGGTMTTIAHTMDLVPTVRDYDYGQSYLYAALTVLPNIFGTPLHPSKARGTASDWLVRTTSYQSAVRGGGVGYSFIAEAYLNFGWMGPLVVMVLLGFAFATLECAATRQASPGLAALMGVVLYFAVIYARAETTNIVRGIIWCGIAPLFVLNLFHRLKRRRSATLSVFDATAASLSRTLQLGPDGRQRFPRKKITGLENPLPE